MANPILAASEPLIGLAEAGKPSRSHPTTVSRWCSNGIQSRTGERVKLEHVRAGGKLLTSGAAVVRFFTALSGETPAMPPVPTPAARRRAAEDAMRELEAAGA